MHYSTLVVLQRCSELRPLVGDSPLLNFAMLSRLLLSTAIHTLAAMHQVSIVFSQSLVDVHLPPPSCVEASLRSCDESINYTFYH